MFRELDVVVLVRDVPAEGLTAGCIGTIVYVYTDSAFEVEFIDTDGTTIAVATVAADDIRPAIRGREPGR
ncbi:hypothetical protein BKG75_13135 [Mycobacteroides chelonae]|nr:DUF4926 domain-containing protein [[Mycobacterium] chelonae subsp. gwanakae]OHU16840.1 hypothetical protein BKG75_13135 [Mycobacteroides chelonae]